MVAFGCLRKPVIFLMYGVGKARPSRKPFWVFPTFLFPFIARLPNCAVLTWYESFPAPIQNGFIVSVAIMLNEGRVVSMCQPTHNLYPRSKKQPGLPLSSVFSLASLPSAEYLFIDYDILWEVFADDLSLCWFLPSLSLCFFIYCTVSIHTIE